MRFWTYGPFEVDLNDKSVFWGQAKKITDHDEYEIRDLKRAIGCYLFVMRRGKSVIPYYVGKTTAVSGFEGEIFTGHKLDHYKAAIDKRATYKPYMFLFPLTTQGEDGFSAARSSGKPLIDWLERILIGMALARNPAATNKRDTKNHLHCIVDGVLGPRQSKEKYEAAYYARLALTDHGDWSGWE